jgi:hypothetical protein
MLRPFPLSTLKLGPSWQYSFHS